MEATKVTIHPSTMQGVKLTPKRRKELRREAVLALIRHKPYGKRLLTRELLDVTDLTTNSGAHIYLKNLERDGYITKHQIGLRSAFYTVNEPVNTIQPRNQLIDLPGAPPLVMQPTLEEQAMQFAWEHPLYNNDLREFIKWTNKEGN